MATHSTAYIPTNRTPGEYIMSEGWSDGMLSSTGLYWYQSVPRMDEAIRATLLVGGSPVFAPAGSTRFEVKEIDYIAEGVRDDLYGNGMTDEEIDSFVEGVETTVEALDQGNWDTAASTEYAKMGLDAQMEKGLTLNTSLHQIADFSDVPSYSAPNIAYDVALLVESVKQYDPSLPYDPNIRSYVPYTSTEYFYHPTGQWWSSVLLTDGRWMWTPMVVGFAIENRQMEDIQALHAEYPEQYVLDIAALAQFEAARSA